MELDEADEMVNLYFTNPDGNSWFPCAGIPDGN